MGWGRVAGGRRVVAGGDAAAALACRLQTQTKSDCSMGGVAGDMMPLFGQSLLPACNSGLPVMLPAGAAAGPSGRPWSDQCTEHSTMRRRKWLRQRRRRPTPAAGSGGGAAPAAAAAGAAADAAAGPGDSSGPVGPAGPSQPGEGMVLVTVLLCTLLRGSKLQVGAGGLCLSPTCAPAAPLQDWHVLHISC